MQEMQQVGRQAPQQYNTGGGNGVYGTPRRPGGAATGRVPGLATMLSGQTAQPTGGGGPVQPAAGAATYRPVGGLAPGRTVQRPPQQGPVPGQVQNRAFANWNEPGSAYGPAKTTWTGPPVQATIMEGAGTGYTGSPIQGYVLDTGRRQAGGRLYGAALPPQSDAGSRAGAEGPPMMGPATGQMSLSGAINSAPTNRGFWNDLGQGVQNAFQQWTQSTQADQETSGQSGSGAQAEPAQSRQLTPEERQAAINNGLDPDDPAVIAMFNQQQQTRDGSTGDIYQDLQNDANYNQGIGGIPTPNSNTRGTLAGAIAGEVQNAGYEAGRAAGAFPAGMAEALNEYTKRGLGEYYDDWQDIQKMREQGESLMDPAQQAAADAAERAAMQAGINAQRDEQLRMLMGQRGRGGLVGSGADVGLLNSALRAQALGEQQLAQDQYQRMLGRTQLGGQLISDYGRQKYGLMSDAYASPGEIAAMLLQGAQVGADVVNKMPGSRGPLSLIFG